MQKLNCLIIEDEPLAAEIVQSYIEKIPFLRLDGICRDAISALKHLKEQRVDVIFLDIHLPKVKGLDFLKMLQVKPEIIITSAYKQYALDGYEQEVTDYLLKPFSFERFLASVRRLKRTASEVNQLREGDYRYFNVNKKRVKVYMDDILYIESLKDYVKICTREKTIITKFQLGELEKLIDPARFMRVHRSFIVSKNKINSFSYHELDVQGNTIPIGRSFSGIVKKEIERN